MSFSRQNKRDDGPLFQNNNYYRFFNPVRLNATLYINDRDGKKIDVKADPNTSAENWHLFEQEGRYFIRPYDKDDSSYREYQLGIVSKTQATPVLLKRSGDLGQQWFITKESDINGDALYKIRNGLMGTQKLSLTQGFGPPAMQDAGSGTLWSIEINASAGTPGTNDKIASIEVSSSVACAEYKD